MSEPWMHWDGSGKLLFYRPTTGRLGSDWHARPANPGYQTPFNPSPPRALPGPKVGYAGRALPMNPPQMAKFLTSQGASPKSIGSAIGNKPYMGLNPDQLRQALRNHVWESRKANVYNALKQGARTVVNVGKQLMMRSIRAVKNPIVLAVIAAVAAVAGIAYLIYRGVKGATEPVSELLPGGDEVELGPPRSIEEMWQYGRARVHTGVHYIHPRLRGVIRK